MFISKPEKILRSNHIEFSATSAKLATSRSSKIAYQSFIKRRTTSIQEIRLAIDETNIISQKVNRIKRKKKLAHAMTMKQVKSDEISAYHTALSCFIAARRYYFKESTKKSSKNES